MQETCCPIVFVDNSNVDRNVFDDLKGQYGHRLEILVFDGNKDKTHGKGYGEMEIISYALAHSKFIINRTSCRILKITGRLIVRNVVQILKHDRWHVFPSKSVVCVMSKDLAFADSRVFLSSGAFLQSLALQKEKVDDLHGVYFEHLLCRQIKEQADNCFFPFLAEPMIDGVSGSTGQAYVMQKRNLLFKLRYVRFQFGLQQQFARQGGGKPLPMIHKIIGWMFRTVCRLLEVLVK